MFIDRARMGGVMRIKFRSMTLALLLTMLGTVLFANISSAAGENSDCLNCHGELSVKEQGGERLYVDSSQFADSGHNLIGCVSCHDSVTPRHPNDASRPGHLKCKECHGGIAQEYEKSLHGRNATCTDCHNPHQSRKMAFVPGAEITAICTRCHTRPAIIKKHEKWLPQADFHLDVQPCITCHTGSINYCINLSIEKQDRHGSFRLATYDDLSPLISDNDISSLIDTNGDNFISLQELRTANKNGRSLGMRLRGMMMPEVMSHSFQILGNRRDCTFCHVSGTKKTQNSVVFFPTDTGIYKQLLVEKGAVLDILYGTPDFYMTGATRSRIFSIIGALIIACGLILPVGHGTVRFLSRKMRAPASHIPATEVNVYMQPTSIRVWHWIHVLSIVTLCLTGAQIRFPVQVNLFGGYRAAVLLHNTAGITLAASMVFWFIYYVIISHSIGRIYFLTGENVKHGLVRQAIYYAVNYFRGRANPFHATPVDKFNALQKSAYLVIMFVFMPLVIFTGILLIDILPLRSMLFELGGIKLIDGLHFLSACSLCAFLFTHFYLTTLGPTPFSEMRTMWTGWESEDAAAEKIVPPALPEPTVKGDRLR